MLTGLGSMTLTNCARKSTRHLRSLMTMSRLKTLMVPRHKMVALQNSNRMAKEKRRRPRLRCPSPPEVPTCSRFGSRSLASRRTYYLWISMMKFSPNFIKPTLLKLSSSPIVPLAAELTRCLGLASIGVPRLPLIFLTTSLTRSCIIEGVSGQTGISYR